MIKIEDIDENPMGMPTEEELLIKRYDADEVELKKRLDEE